MKDYSKTKVVLDQPLLHSKRLELNYAHVEMDLLTRQAIYVPITSVHPQAEGTGESGGLLCKDYMGTSTSSFMCFPY
jgi:hypothetical protein